MFETVRKKLTLIGANLIPRGASFGPLINLKVKLVGMKVLNYRSHLLFQKRTIGRIFG